MSVQALIFDIYGTLLEVGPPPPDAEARWQSLFRDRLHTEPHLNRLEFSLASSKAIARHHAAARARAIPSPEVYWPSVVMEIVPELARLSRRDREEFLFRQIQIGHTTRMTSETAAALCWLKERPCRLGIASNAQAYTLRELEEALANHGLGLDLFDRDFCFWSFEHGFGKPDPHVFQILTTRLEARGIWPPAVLMVGDHPDNDIGPARAHGWQTWWLSPQAAAGQGGGWPALLDCLSTSFQRA
jgi:FMN phosphatase YigB (HAD superfamily)